MAFGPVELIVLGGALSLALFIVSSRTKGGSRPLVRYAALIAGGVVVLYVIWQLVLLVAFADGGSDSWN